MDMGPYDLILGMDWLTNYHAINDGYAKKVTIAHPRGETIVFFEEKYKMYPITYTTRKQQKNYVGWLSTIVGEETYIHTPHGALVVNEFMNDFPKDLPGYRRIGSSQTKKCFLVWGLLAHNLNSGNQIKEMTLP